MSRATNSSCFGEVTFFLAAGLTYITSGRRRRKARTCGDSAFSMRVMMPARPGSNGVPVKVTSRARER